jgi:hypothetical protein
MTSVLAFILAACNAKEKESAEVTNAKPYPLDTCLVCDMKLSMMSKPVVFAYQGQLIKVCDDKEKSDFEKDSAKYLKKLTDAEAQLKK